MIAYFDCFSGISGDMALGAFCDLGVPPAWLGERLAADLGIEAEISVRRVRRKGIAARQATVAANEPAAGPRHFADIAELLENSRLPGNVCRISLEIFDRLAEAEARVHGCSRQEVHFHEVGAVDAIVDIVGAALCVDYLQIERVAASRIPLGRGTVSCAHGTLPVPAPATLEILKDVPVYGTDTAAELVTPTGAAIIRTLAETFGSAPDMCISGTGYGAGSREGDVLPNLLRVMLGRAPGAGERVMMVETCIDDMNPEVYGYLQEQLTGAGALDVWMVPVFMKKNRPGTLLQVLCPHSRSQAMVEQILAETTTTGVRYYEVSRRILHRKPVTVETGCGPVAAKQVTLPDGRTRIVPEYEACRRVAREAGMPLREVYHMVVRQSPGRT
ncbi:MAG TPA: nickel pincer cofactor biosynthesis protein LarC [Desulfosalsimonadaceae bacterium]|nr:nickel pincer cofactor biosynthesis protein LarC [Desulfosalsimonadaceae bacterium]